MSCIMRMYWICCGRILLDDEKPISQDAAFIGTDFKIEGVDSPRSSQLVSNPASSSKIQEAPETLTFNENQIPNPRIQSVQVSGRIQSMSPARSVPNRRIEWVIGLDFGTTYSGFAYSEATDEPRIYLHYDWPQGKRMEKPYCKTLTGLFYKRDATGNLKCASWGHPARSDYTDQRDSQHGGQQQGFYLTTFKLLLQKNLDDPGLARSLPGGLTPARIITDYVRLIGEYALAVVEKHSRGGGGEEFRRDAVQWYVTVPSIWSESAKQQMRTCVVNAGLVDGGVEAVNVVLEPEAASFNCHKVLRESRMDVSLKRNDKILVADVGGGTVDIVVQELVGNSHNYKVKELTKSSGGFCGGTFVDHAFLHFLSHKIPCLDSYLKSHPSYQPRLLKDWEEIKSAFGHELMSDAESTKDIQLPNELAMQREASGEECDDSSVVELTEQDLKAIFDPVVEQILELIEAQLAQVAGIKVMFVVGGFAGSPYLMQCIRTRFGGEVRHIVSPPGPGSAVVQGAVALALHPHAVVSRVSRQSDQLRH